jgi:hypothetical protein
MSAVCATRFVAQSRILDGNDGLSGEVLHQRDLLVGEGPNLISVQDERADQLVILQHWDGQNRPDTT